MRFLNEIKNQLTEKSKSNLDKDINLDELSKALYKMKNNKSPGQDGICVEFYKVYWNDVKNDVLEVFVHGLNNKQLAYSQYMAVIKLLYKKGNRQDIRNWRPISLLNVDFKILSKALAERIKHIFPEIINTDQRGCIKGRYIGENIRLVEDIIHAKDDESVILLLDQEKAFDRVEWRWLSEVLRKFNFGERFISWIETMYNCAKSAVVTNGFLWEYFSISRGIRQGDAMSALLFIIQTEPLAEAIRSSCNIQGISVNNETEVRICQYVDDTNIFLAHHSYIDPCFEIIKEFEKASGSKLNESKTNGLITGTYPTRADYGIEITVGPEMILGVPIGKEALENSFWETSICKVQAKLKLWSMRDLSFDGKVQIMKSIGLATVAYAMEMKIINQDHVKKLNKILWHFLWSGKSYSVKKEICVLPTHAGGLGMIDLSVLIKVKRILWAVRMLKTKCNENWAVLPMKYMECLDRDSGFKLFALRVNDSTDSIKQKKIPLFYKECILSLQEIYRTGEIIPDNRNEFIWCNSKFQFKDSPLFFKHWSQQGIAFVTDLVKNGTVDSSGIFNKLVHKAGFMFEIQTIKSSIPPAWLNEIDRKSEIFIQKDDILKKLFLVPGHGIKTLGELTSKDIYGILTSNVRNLSKSDLYWSMKFPNSEINFKRYFRNNFVNSFLPRKCKDFNWRIFYGQVNVETRLRRMNLSSGMCCICKTFEENLEHMMYHCQGIRSMWTEIESLLCKVLHHDFSICLLNVLLGHFDDDQFLSDVVNVLISIARWEIWKRRNHIRYEKYDFPVKNLTSKVKNEIKRHLQMIQSNNGNTLIENILRELWEE